MQLRPRVQAIADELLDAVEARGEMDLAAEYAFPLPITVIAELLGVPTADQERFRAWSDAIITPALSQEETERFFAQMGEFVTYLQDLFAERRANPQDDLISALLRARDEGDALSEDEVFGTVVLLIVAGHETTVGLIGNGVLHLLRHPDQLALVREDESLLAAAVEELLRFDGPVERTLNRWAATDVELGGKTIRRGEMVIAIVGVGRPRSRALPDPDRLDVTRAGQPHLAFGRGSHYCLGAPLARLEAEIALATLFRRLPGTAPRDRAGRAGVAADARRSGGSSRYRSPGSSTTSVRPSTALTRASWPADEAGVAARLPDLAAHPHLPIRIARPDRDRLRADERLDPDRRSPPVREPPPEPRLAELDRRADADGDPAPRVRQDEEREPERDEERHGRSLAVLAACGARRIAASGS